MVRREEYKSLFKTCGPPELDAPPIACEASHVRIPPTSVTLKATTVETLVSWGVLPFSLQESVPRNGLVVLSGPRSLHLRSGVGVAEVLSLALERRDSRQLPNLRAFSHATNPAAFATNWRNLWPYVESLGIWIGETWSKALERGDAGAVGRLVDVIAERQSSYEKNVLAYDNTPLPIPEESNVAAASVPAACPATQEQGLHKTGVNSSSRPSQQSAIASTTGFPAASARRKVVPFAVSHVKDNVVAIDGHGRLLGRSERSQAAASREPTQAAAPSLPLLSAAKVRQNSRENQGQHSQAYFELTELHYQKPNTPMALQGQATGMLPRSDLLSTRDAPFAQLRPDAAQVLQAKATETTPAAATAEAAVAAVCLKQAECQTDIAGPYVALSAGAQSSLPLLHDNQSNETSRQSSSLALNAEGRCRDGAASLSPLAFSPVECVGTAAPLRIESNPLVGKTVFHQRKWEYAHQLQEQKHDIHMNQPVSGELTTHVRKADEVPLPFSPFEHRLLSENKTVAHFFEADKELAHQEAGSGSCCPPAGIAKIQTQLGKTSDATATEDQAFQRQMEYKDLNDEDNEDNEPLGAEELHQDTLTPQIAEGSPAIAATQPATGAESVEGQRDSLQLEPQLTSRRRTSSIFKAAGGDWGVPQDVPFVASVTRQQNMQQEGRQQQRPAELLQPPNPNKRWVEEHQDCSDSCPYKENIEELLLQSLQIHFGFNRRTSIQLVQQKGTLVGALFAEAGTQTFAQGVAGWIAALKESAATAARRLEGEPQKTGIVMQIYYNGAAFLYRQGQLVHATALLQALILLLLEMIPADEALQERLLCHLRRSTAASSIAQLAAAAAEAETYVHSKAATEMLAAIGSLCHLWCRMEPSDIWSGGFLRRSIGCDVSYFLLTRLLLQQQQRMEQQHQLEGKPFTYLSPKMLEAIAVEACTAALQQNNPDRERAAALLILGPISRCCSSLLVHAEREDALQLMRQISKCIRLGTTMGDKPALLTAARESLADLVLGTARTGSSELAVAILEDAAILRGLLPDLTVVAAAEKGVCTSCSVVAALTSAISATSTVIERAEAVDSRNIFLFIERYLKLSSAVGEEQARICEAFFKHPSTSGELAAALLSALALVRMNVFEASLLSDTLRCSWAEAAPRLTLQQTEAERRRKPMRASLLCGLVVSCWEHHGDSITVQQTTKKLLVLDRLAKTNTGASGSPGGGLATIVDSDCLATSLKAFVLQESQEVFLMEEAKEALLALCDDSLLERDDAYSRFLTSTHSEVSPALSFSFSSLSRFLHELQDGRDAASAGSQQQYEHEQEADYETRASVHWLSMVGGPASFASFSEPIDSRRPSTSGSDKQQQRAVASGSTEPAVASPEDQPTEKNVQQGPHIIHRSLAATLHASEISGVKGEYHSQTTASAPAPSVGMPLQEIECRLLLHYFRPVFLKLFDLVQKAAQKQSGGEAFTDRDEELLPLTALPFILQAVGAPSNSRSRVFCTNLCRAMKQQLARLNSNGHSQCLYGLTLPEFEIFLCQLAFSMHSTSRPPLTYRGVSLTPKTERGTQIHSLIHRLKKEGEVPGSRTSCLPPLIRGCEARLAARHASLLIESLNCLLEKGVEIHRLPPGLAMIEQKGGGGTIVRRVVLRQGGETAAAGAPPRMQVLLSEDSMQGLFDTASTAQHWAVAGALGPYLPFRGSIGDPKEKTSSKVEPLPLGLCRGRFNSVQNEPLQRAVEGEGTALYRQGKTTHEERRLVDQALRSDAQVQCGAPKADGKRLQAPPLSCAPSASHRPPSLRVHLKSDGDCPALAACNNSSNPSTRHISCCRPPVSKGEREEIHRAQQELLRSPPVQQVLQQAKKGIHKLFEAFASDGVINHKGWGRFSLFANLAPCPEMLRFFKQVAGSIMNEAAFEAALFQLTISLYGIDVKAATDETMGRCFASLLSHCLVDDVKALREGQGRTSWLASHLAKCRCPHLMITTEVIELSRDHVASIY